MLGGGKERARTPNISPAVCKQTCLWICQCKLGRAKDEKDEKERNTISYDRLRRAALP